MFKKVIDFTNSNRNWYNHDKKLKKPIIYNEFYLKYLFVYRSEESFWINLEIETRTDIKN